MRYGPLGSQIVNILRSQPPGTWLETREIASMALKMEWPSQRDIKPIAQALRNLERKHVVERMGGLLPVWRLRPP